jgi:hypothetical protein
VHPQIQLHGANIRQGALPRELCENAPHRGTRIDLNANRRLCGSGREKLLLQPVVTAGGGPSEQNQQYEYQSKRTSA